MMKMTKQTERFSSKLSVFGPFSHSPRLNENGIVLQAATTQHPALSSLVQIPSYMLSD